MMRDHLDWTSAATHTAGPGLCALPTRADEIQRPPLSAGPARPRPGARNWSTKPSWRGRKANSSRPARREIAPLVGDMPRGRRRLHRLVRAAARQRPGPGRSAVSLARNARHARSDALVPDPGGRGRSGLRRSARAHAGQDARAAPSSKWRAISGTRWAAAPARACTARCSSAWRSHLDINPVAGSGRAGSPGARQHDGRPWRATAATHFSPSARSASSR